MAKKQKQISHSGDCSMTRFIVVGVTGMMGRVAVRDLFETTKDEIVIAARSGAEEAAKKYKNERVSGIELDVKDQDSTARIFKDTNIVLNCAIYYMNLNVMQACLKAGVHYLDLGGLFHMTKKQLALNAQFKDAGLTAILGMGSTPGITNVLAAYGSREFEKIESIDIKVGWKDFSKRIGPESPVPYAIATLVDEFTEKPAVFQNRKMKFVEPVSGKEKIKFPKPIGEQTAFYTLHSELATFPQSFANKGIKNASFRVSFDDEFVNNILYLVSTGITKKELTEYNGMKISPLDFLARTIAAQPVGKVKKLEDYECLRVEIRGLIAHGSKLKALQIDCLAKSYPKYGFAAGDIDTGTPPSIVAQMIARGEITDLGVMPSEFHVPEQKFFKELNKRGMNISKRWV